MKNRTMILRRNKNRPQNMLHLRSRYMDPYCTTSMLGHPQHSVEQQNGIGRKDYITLWDWFEIPKGKGYGLKFFPVKQKGARWPTFGRVRKLHSNHIIPLAMAAVPNNGLKSEKSAAYQNPIPFTVRIYKSNLISKTD